MLCYVNHFERSLVIFVAAVDRLTVVPDIIMLVVDRPEQHVDT